MTTTHSTSTKTLTQNARVYEYLSLGAEPTVGELRTRLKIQNPTAVINNMRSVLIENGSIFRIYSNTRRNHRGAEVIRYRLGFAPGYRSVLNPFEAAVTR